MASMRASSPSTPAATARQSAASPSMSATSTSVRMLATGLRSSCEASDTNWRWRRADCSSRASMAFIVRARRPISSPEAGSGTRRCMVAPPMASTSARMASTGRSARPTSAHATPATSRTSPGSPHHSARRTASTLRATSSTGVAAHTVSSPPGVRTVAVAVSIGVDDTADGPT
jgi:hypothetical protein